MKLYLMRHGQAASPDIDPQQGLTAEGRVEIEQLADRLAAQGVSFSQVWHSDKIRARQTAEIMVSIISSQVTPQRHSGLKPNDEPSLLLPELDSMQQDTLIVSHLPFVPGLVGILTGKPQGMGYAAGTVICLEKKANGWQVEWIESP